MELRRGPNIFLDIDDKTMAIEIYSKGERLLCYFDKEDYERVKPFRWSATSTSSKNRTRYLRSHPYRSGPSEKWVMIFHQLVMSFPVVGQIDHINQNGLDNRKTNLRVVSQLENARNKRYSTTQKSGYFGVVENYSKGKPWKVYVNHAKKRIYIGAYKTKEEAALAYDAKAIELRGDFAVLNFARMELN